MHPEAEKFFSYIAKQKLTGEQSRVLLYLISKIDFNGYWRVSHQEIADLLRACLKSFEKNRNERNSSDLHRIMNVSLTIFP